MLTYNFTEIGSDSLYEYLYKCIKNDIVKGTIKAGEKLPSKRNFAKNLGVSVITVENAYEQLIAEGYIHSIPKSGFYVNELETFPEEPIVTAKEIAAPRQEEERAYLADFTSNQTPSDLFPFTMWAKMIRDVLSGNQEQLMKNPPCGGTMTLRREIAAYLRNFRGMHVVPEQIILGAGTEYLYSLLLQLMGTTAVYGLENPGYQKIGMIYRTHGVPYEYINIDQAGVSITELEDKNVDIVHISPSHHYPTGIVMPISRRYELLGWAAKKEGRYIIEDDYDSELRLSGQPIPTLQSIDISERVIYINTFTKTLASTMRIGYMVLPPHLLEKFYEKLGFYSCTVSNFEQYALARFMENGGFEKHVNRLRNYYHNKKNQILEAIKTSPLAPHVTITGEEAGVHFLMEIDTKKSEREYMDAVEAAGIHLSPLSKFYHLDGYEDSNVYVMNYSSIDIDQIDKIVDILWKCC